MNYEFHEFFTSSFVVLLNLAVPYLHGHRINFIVFKSKANFVMPEIFYRASIGIVKWGYLHKTFLKAGT